MDLAPWGRVPSAANKVWKKWFLAGRILWGKVEILAHHSFLGS